MEKDLIDYNKNDIFWKDFMNLPKNPYKLEKNLKGFKCLLLYPVKEDDLSREYYPTPLGNMASLIRMNKGEAEIRVQSFRQYNPEEFKNYNLICFYPMTASFEQLMQFSEKIKRDHTSVKTCFVNSDQHQHEMILCNPEAMEFAKTIMQRNKTLDYVLVGEAEAAFTKLCEKIYNSKGDLNKIPACVYRENGEVIISEIPIEPVDFKFLPFPARDFLEKTISPNGINTVSPRIQASRGCMAPCYYCSESRSNITKGNLRKGISMRDISKAVDEIQMLQEKYGVVFFNSIDSSFEDPGKNGIKRMNKFCDLIQDRGIEASFKIHIRQETIYNSSEEFLKKLKQTGIDILISGIESNLEKELKSYRKISSIEKSIASVKKLDEMNQFFQILGYIMFTPILELDDLQKKADFLKSIHYGWDHIFMTSNMLIYPGTIYHRNMEKLGLTLEHDKLATVIPYKFNDERVGLVAEEMSNLKIRHPEAPKLNNKIYDSKNIISRFQNKINRHLWENEIPFRFFREQLEEICSETEFCYHSFFTELVDLARIGFPKSKKDLAYKEFISGNFQNFLERTEQNLNNFLESCRMIGSTDKLFLHTWASLENTKTNRAKGKK